MAWLALESDPEIFTSYMRDIGLLAPWQFGELWSLDESPDNAVALVVAHGPSPGFLRGEPTEAGLFIKQIEGLGDACGLIAALHAIANSDAEVQEGSLLSELLTDLGQLSPEARGRFLSNHQGLQERHHAIAQQGQTEAPSEGSAIFHFVAIHQGIVYDGLRESPQRLENDSLTSALNKIRDLVESGELGGALSVMYLHKGE